MPEQLKTQFQFRSLAFNCTEPKEYFINDCCFGDDLADWLAGAFQAQGYDVGEKIAEDWGWIAQLRFKDQVYFIGLGFQPNDETIGDRWLGWVEKPIGLLQSIFRHQEKYNLPLELLSLVDSTLRSHENIFDLTWSINGRDRAVLQ